MRLLSILPGISTRSIIFAFSILSVPILLKDMGVTKYSEYVFVLGLINLSFLFEFGNSNNLVELPVKNMKTIDKFQILINYKRRAFKYASFSVMVWIIYILFESSFKLNSGGIQFSKSMQLALIVGVLGAGIGFQANVYSKFSIALGGYKFVMNLLAISNIVSVTFLILVSHINAPLWICFLSQFVVQHLIVITILRRRYFLSISKENMHEKKDTPTVVVPEPHILFKFYAIFSPIYNSLIILLFSRHGNENLFTSAATFYRISSIPLVFASFAWLNLLWIDIGRIKGQFSGLEARSLISKKFFSTAALMIPFFLVVAFLGSDLFEFWTGNTLQISSQLVLQFTILGYIQFIGVIPSAVTLVYRKTRLILTTHSLFLVTILIVFLTVDFSLEATSILPMLILIEVSTLLLPNLYWLFFRLPSYNSELGNKK